MPCPIKHCRLTFFYAALCWLLLGGPALALSSVTVLGDPVMASALAEIARQYARDNQMVVNTTFTSMEEQEKEITEGGSADVLITPRQAWIDSLKSQGLIDVYSQILVARNRLALVGPLESPLEPRGHFPVNQLIQAMGGEQLFVVGNPETLQEGVYGKEALRSIGVAEDLEEFTLYIKRQEQMFDMVEKQGAYGLFFYSSIMGRSGIRVIDMLPENAHKPIEYYGV
ncbi:MAG: molybdate ABC transporter substrate-binding protein, partial [Proteobacteria bacterium]|nr:molybdate ABC transporter substrate-binding protein [Pseudomonadota bacterium]